MSNAVRLAVNLAPEVAGVLKEMASEKKISITEMVRRAISTEKYISDAERRNAKILVEDEDGKIRQVVFR